MILLRSLLHGVLSGIAVFPFAAVLILVSPLPHRYPYAVARGWVRICLWLLDKICGLRYEVSGSENLPDEPCVVYLRHSSVWETLAELEVFPPQTWVLKRELKWIPVFGWALTALRPIAIDRRARGTAVKQVIRQGRERLADGLWVMIFPEGTRMPPGQSRRYGLSGALLAAKTNRPLLPVAHNAEDFWPRHSRRKLPGTIKLVIGPPIETDGRKPDAINADARDWIESQMRQISRHYGAAPAA